MLQKFTFAIVTIFISVTSIYSQTGLGMVKGSVRDEKTKVGLEYCKVVLILNGSTKAGASTDEKGEFQINSITPGTYDVEVRSSDGYQPFKLTGFKVIGDKISFLDNIALSI